MIGIDEVGRGCLAGPLLVVAARQRANLPSGIADSKLLTRQRREFLYTKLKSSCDFGEGWVSPAEIDERGLTLAMKLGVKRALRAVNALNDELVIMDGPYNYLPTRYKKYECLIDADAKVPLVSAASIYAKVTRDRLMIRLKSQYPLYGFESHVGYATPHHLAAINQHGAIKNIHRMRFNPLQLLAENL